MPASGSGTRTRARTNTKVHRRNSCKPEAFGHDAADRLNKRDGIFSGATGASETEFLNRYAQLVNKTPQQLQDWVNRLSDAQLNSLSQVLMQLAEACHGDVNQFTNGPVHRFGPHGRNEDWNTVTEFRGMLLAAGINP